MGDETTKHANLCLRSKSVFGKAMQIEKNVARIEHNSEDYRIVRYSRTPARQRHYTRRSGNCAY
jgi:hypothetical protein